MIAAQLRQHKPAVVLTFALFALWGIGHRLYETLLPGFAQILGLDSSRLILAQSLYSLIYFAFALPAAFYSRFFGSKATLVFGLGCWAIGAFLFYPAVQRHAFLFFIIAAGVMSLGYIFLEIGANPLVAAMGPPETTVRRLNFAHACFPLGTLVALYIGRWLILSDNALPLDQLASAVVRPYMVLGAGVLALAFLVDNMAFPAIATARSSHHGFSREIRVLLGRRQFLAAVGALACTSAARTGTWALSLLYITTNIPGVTTLAAADYLLASFVAFAAGRWTGAFLMLRFDPLRLLALFAGSGIACGLITTLGGGVIGVYAIVASNFSVSIAYATVLGTAIKDLGPMTKTGTALMYMGSAGAAVGLVAMHLIWTVSSLQLAMVVPLIGFAGITTFALTRKSTGTAPAA